MIDIDTDQGVITRKGLDQMRADVEHASSQDLVEMTHDLKLLHGTSALSDDDAAEVLTWIVCRHLHLRRFMENAIAHPAPQVPQ